MDNSPQAAAPAFRLTPLAEADATRLYYAGVELGYYSGSPTPARVQAVLARAREDAEAAQEMAARGRPPPAQYWVAEATGAGAGGYVAYVGAHRENACYRFCVSFRTGLPAKTRRAIVAAALTRLKKVLVGVPCVYAQAIDPQTYESYGFTTIDRTTIRRKPTHKNRALQRPMCVVAYAFENTFENSFGNANYSDERMSSRWRQCVQHTPDRSSQSANSSVTQCSSTLSFPA